ncbi:MAG: 50S ribosomal protein L18e [Nanoarchaeota archaeon]|nr:50S ribosomal protein L18e [Nanoarchaeota archaeon]MBU1028013.1 50S ribosomal protein L18e [Nanoarchaeota archaeon]
MSKSNTKIEKQTKKKHNIELVETIRLAKKNKRWKEVAEILSGPRKKQKNFNVDKLKENVVVPGKILSQGEIGKKIKVVAFSFSEKAKEKLKQAGCEYLTISEEIKKNPERKGLVVLR